MNAFQGAIGLLNAFEWIVPTLQKFVTGPRLKVPYILSNAHIVPARNGFLGFGRNLVEILPTSLPELHNIAQEPEKQPESIKNKLFSFQSISNFFPYIP